MDSTLSQNPASSLLGDQVSPLRRSLARHLPWFDTLSTRGTRVRQTSLDPWRLTAFSLTLLAVMVLLTTAVTRDMHGEQLARSTQAAAALLEERLQAAHEQGIRLAESTALTQKGWGCTESLVNSLLHESLESMHVRRWVVQRSDGSLACGPEGSMPAVPLPEATRRGTSSLVSRQSIAPGAVLTRALDADHLLVALLDERTLSLPASGPWIDVTARGSVLGLVAADGRRLPLLGGDHVAWARSAIQAELSELEEATFSLSSEALSPAYGFSVQARMHASVLRQQVLDLWPWLISLWLALTALIASLVWRVTVKRARLVYRIERALRQRQFEPFIQPIMNMSTGACVGGEILMRWAHPERGILAPGEFIEEAERTGLIVGMSELVMARAAFRLSTLARDNPECHFSFNVTPSQLRLPNFAQTLSELFRQDTIPRQQVLLELTERDFVDPAARNTLMALSAAGWRIAIDDFGTGQSSLVTLESLPIDRIKIDRAFVSTVGEQTANRPVLDAIINLGRELGITLIAEGIETESQWQYLRERGVHAAQGFLMARPMSLDAFETWLATHRANRIRLEASEGQRPSTPSASGRDLAIEQLCTHMLSEGGVDQRDRLYYLRSYRQCFIAREAVDWLVAQQRISRQEAVRLGRRMVAQGLIRHVLNEHDFADAEWYFVATPVQAHQLAVLPPVAQLLQAMSSANEGLPLTNHRRGLLMHRRAATGRAVVNWLIKRHDISRTTAAQWAAQLMKQGALRHVFDDRAFSDSLDLFRLK